MIPALRNARQMSETRPESGKAKCVCAPEPSHIELTSGAETG